MCDVSGNIRLFFRCYSKRVRKQTAVDDLLRFTRLNYLPFKYIEIISLFIAMSKTKEEKKVSPSIHGLCTVLRSRVLLFFAGISFAKLLLHRLRSCYESPSESNVPGRYVSKRIFRKVDIVSRLVVLLTVEVGKRTYDIESDRAGHVKQKRSLNVIVSTGRRNRLKFDLARGKIDFHVKPNDTRAFGVRGTRSCRIGV